MPVILCLGMTVTTGDLLIMKVGGAGVKAEENAGETTKGGMAIAGGLILRGPMVAGGGRMITPLDVGCKIRMVLKL